MLVSGRKILASKTNNYLSPKIILCFINDAVHQTSDVKTHYREKGSNLLEILVEKAPITYQPYMKLMRLDRPIGTWLLFLPCTWGIALATPLSEVIDLYTLSLFAIGATLMRGAGCTINDMWDKDFDKHVERTKSRPIASGIVSVPKAIIFLGAQMSLSLLILLQFNWYSVALGLASTGLVISYPLFKRFTYWPQVVLGFTFNYGAILGYSAIAGFCDWQLVLPTYIAGLCWTIVYDTIYALQDIEDDKLLGLKSTAIYFGDKGKRWMSLFAIGMGSLLTLTGINYGAGPLFYGGTSLAMLHLAYQLYSLKPSNRADCLKLFKSNRTTGLIIFSAIVLDRYFNCGLPFS